MKENKTDKMSREEIQTIMKKNEIKERLENPLQYKFNSLKEYFSNPDERHKGSPEIIANHKSSLEGLEKMEECVNHMWREIFTDEPTDEEIAQFTKFARRCDECGKLFNEGYCVEGGEEYYCSDKCLHKHYTPAQWNELYNDGNGDSYYTTWEDEDDFLYYADGTEVDRMKENKTDKPEYYCPVCGDTDVDEQLNCKICGQWLGDEE